MDTRTKHLQQHRLQAVRQSKSALPLSCWARFTVPIVVRVVMQVAVLCFQCLCVPICLVGLAAATGYCTPFTERSTAAPRVLLVPQPPLLFPH